MAEVPGKRLDDPRISTDIQCRYGRFLHVNPYNPFLVDEGIEDPNTTINGPSSAASGPMMAQH